MLSLPKGRAHVCLLDEKEHDWMFFSTLNKVHLHEIQETTYLLLVIAQLNQFGTGDQGVLEPATLSYQQGGQHFYHYWRDQNPRRPFSSAI